MLNLLAADEIEITIKLHQGQVSQQNITFLKTLILAAKGMVDESILKEIRFLNA